MVEVGYTSAFYCTLNTLYYRIISWRLDTPTLSSSESKSVNNDGSWNASPTNDSDRWDLQNTSDFKATFHVSSNCMKQFQTRQRPHDANTVTGTANIWRQYIKVTAVAPCILLRVRDSIFRGKMSVCLSVRSSVTCRYSTRLNISSNFCSPSDSHIILVFLY